MPSPTDRQCSTPAWSTNTSSKPIVLPTPPRKEAADRTHPRPRVQPPLRPQHQQRLHPLRVRDSHGPGPGLRSSQKGHRVHQQQCQTVRRSHRSWQARSHVKEAGVVYGSLLRVSVYSGDSFALVPPSEPTDFFEEEGTRPRHPQQIHPHRHRQRSQSHSGLPPFLSWHRGHRGQAESSSDGASPQIGSQEPG